MKKNQSRKGSKMNKSKMNKVFLAVFVMIVGLMAHSASAYACDCWGPWHGPGSWNSRAAVPDEARLSVNQQTTIDKIQNNYRDRFDSLRNRLSDANTVLDRELAKSKPEMARIKNLRKQRADLIAEMESLRDQMNAEVKKVLTERQRTYYGDYAFCPCGMHGRSPGMHSGNTNASAHGGYCWGDWSW